MVSNAQNAYIYVGIICCLIYEIHHAHRTTPMPTWLLLFHGLLDTTEEYIRITRRYKLNQHQDYYMDK